MADVIRIGQIDIDMNQAVKDAEALKQSLDFVNQEMKKAEAESGKTSAKYIELSATQKQLNAEYNNQVKFIGQTIQADTQKQGSLAQMEAQLAVVKKQWKELGKEERENSNRGKELTFQKLKLTNALKKEEIATGDARRNVGNYNDAMKQLSPTYSNLENKAKSYTSVLTKLGPAGILIAAGIAVASSAVLAFFTKSEKGAELLERKLAGLKASFSVLTGELIKLGSAVDTNSEKTFKWGNVFGKVLTVLGTTANFIPSFRKYISELTDDMNTASEAAENYTKMNQKLNDSERAMIVPRAEANKKIAEAKLLYEDETKSIEVRLGALKESLNLEQQTVTSEIAYQNQVIKNLEIINKEKEKAGQLRDEDDLKYQQALAKRIELETESAIKQKKVLSTISAAEKELAGEKVEIQKIEIVSDAEREEIELKALRQMAEEKLAIMDVELAKQKELNEGKFNELQLNNEAELSILREKLDQKLIMQEEFDQKKGELEDMEKQREFEVAQLDYENDSALAEDSIFKRLENEKQGLEMQRKQEVETATRIGADVKKVNDKFDKAELVIEKAKQDAKLALAGGFAQNIAAIFGEQSAVGKTAAIAATTIDTYQSATAAFKSFAGIPVVGVPLGIAAAGAAVASGIANVKKILSVKSGLPGDSGGGSASISSPVAQETQSVANTAVIRSNVNPEIGAGIVSRFSNRQVNEPIEIQPTLVEDEVTSKQRTTSIMKATSVL